MSNEDELLSKLELHPDDPVLLGALGTRLAEQGRDEEAFDVLQRAAAAGPGRAEVLLPLAALLLKNGRTDDAIEFAEAAAVSAPTHAAAALALIGDAYRSRGEGEAALEAYREAARRAPGEGTLEERVEGLQKTLGIP